MFSLLVATLVVKSLQPLSAIDVPAALDIPTFSYASGYLGTTDGLYRLSNDTLERVAFAGENVTAVAVDDGVLYVAKEGEATLLRSVDAGATFTPITVYGLVSRRIAFGPDDHLFVNAGGNMLASDDDGATWKLLYGLPYQGQPAEQLCPLTFERIGTRLLMGGECPLDEGWIGAGELDDDLVSWSIEPQRLFIPNLENRNVQFIRAFNGIVYAGVEGALLASEDNGATFDYLVRYELDAPDRYPYIVHLYVRDDFLLIGGFDKKNDVGYLAYSSDRGATWTDVSHLAGPSYVSAIFEEPSGRVIAALTRDGRVTLAEVVIGLAGNGG